MGRLEEIPGTNIIRTTTDEIRLGHTWHEIDVLKGLIRLEKPKFFVEIGVHEGGLSYLLMPVVGDAKYYGVELYCNLIRPEVLNLYTHIHTKLFCMDCFDMSLWKHLVDKTPKIIYCDGGHKAQELLHFKSTCASGDIILTHDFYDGSRVVKDVPVQNISIEVTYNDIVPVEFDREHFERLDEDLFKETRIIGWKRK